MKRLVLLILILICLVISSHITFADTSKEWVNKGKEFYSSGDYNKAIDAYTRALEINPTDAMIYSSRGLVHLESGNFYKAIIDFNNAIDLDHPKVADVHFRRGVAYEKLGKY